jgi:chromosome partitioning protein
VQAHPLIDVLCSNRETTQTENILMGQLAREMTFANLFPKVDQPYSVVLVDVAPSITLLQTCAMIYAQQVLIPVAMDPLSLQGAAASIETARTLNKLFQTHIRPVAFLPVMIDRRLQMTQVILESLNDLSSHFSVPMLHAIRTDSTVTKCARAKQFLADYDPKCRALEDYNAAAAQLLDLVKDKLDADRQFETTAAQA